MTTLTSPHDLLVAVPFLMGFTPEESIIVIGIREGVITIAMRFDVENNDFHEVVTHLKRWESDCAMVISYTQQRDRKDLNIEVGELISAQGIVVRESLLVRGNRWKSAICEDLSCCPVDGNEMPDLASSAIAAEQVLLGHPMPFASREELHNSLRSDDSLRSMTEELSLAIELVKEIDYHHDPRPFQREGAEAISRLIALAQAGESINDSSLLALVLVRLKDLQVRDYALGSITEENLESLIDLWRWIVRIAPSRFIAPVATLLAASAYEKGDGVLAQSALDLALENDDQYPLAQLLKRVFAAGWPPETFATMRRELHPKISSSIFDQVA
jgi:hypothetical protein